MSKDLSFVTAIHILTLLGYMGEELSSSRFIAQSVQTNPGLIRRLLSKLAQANLIITYQGKDGGAKLKRPAEEISLKAIYDAVHDGPLFALSNRDTYAACPISTNITGILQDYFSVEEQAATARLAQINLAQILNQIPSHH